MSGQSENQYIKIQRLGNLRKYTQLAGMLKANNYLIHYDSKITMSDIATVDANRKEIPFPGPQSDTDPKWFTPGVEYSVEYL